eukprot:GHVS01035847.1.p1 GENE.GHVS01035847.1~~GHVS01035847.1.p1  ORF type:complete len:302 (+),score=92.87 GHVS01035847.1:225-1130(+)
MLASVSLYDFLFSRSSSSSLKGYICMYLFLLAPLLAVCQLPDISSAISPTNTYNKLQEFILPLQQQEQQAPAATSLTASAGPTTSTTATGQSTLQRIRSGFTSLPNRLQRVSGGGGVRQHVDRDNNNIISSVGGGGRLDGSGAAVKMITRDIGMFSRFSSPRSQSTSSPQTTVAAGILPPSPLPVISIGSALTGMETVSGGVLMGGGSSRGGVGGLLRDGGIIRLGQISPSINTAAVGVGSTTPSQLMAGVTKTLLGVDAAGNNNLVGVGVADAFLYSHNNIQAATAAGVGTPGYVGVGPI